MSVPTNKTVSSISQYPLHTARVYFTEKGLLAQQSVAAAAAHATAAANSAAAASTSAGNSASSAATSATSAANTAALYATFHNVYYGSSSTPPATRPDGSSRQGGDLYYQNVNISGGARAGLQVWSANELGVFGWVPSATTPETIDDRVSSLLVPGANIGISYNDTANTLTIATSVTSTMAGEGFRNFYNNIENAQLSHIPLEIKCIALMGAGRPGDAGPAMICQRVNAPITTHKGWLRSSDRYKLSSNPGDSEDNTNGGYWEFVGTNQPIWIEWFGGKADYRITPPQGGSVTIVNPTPTDNRQIILDAIDFFFTHIDYIHISNGITYHTFSSGPTIQLGYGSYYCSDRIFPDRTCTIHGMGRSEYHSYAVTRLVFPAGKSGYFAQCPDLQSSGDPENPLIYVGTAVTLRYIFFESLGHGGQTTAHGLIMRNTCTVEHCGFLNFGGNGIDMAASTDSNPRSNVNLFYINHVTCYANAGDGFHTQYNDANAGVAISPNAMANGGWGINDTCQLGNSWSYGHSDANALGPYNAPGNGGQRTVFHGCYSEGGQPPSKVGIPAMIIGGIQAAGAEVEGFSIIDGSLYPFDIRPYQHDLAAGDILAFSMRNKKNAMYSINFAEPGFGYTWGYESAYGVFAFRYADVTEPKFLAYATTTYKSTILCGRDEVIANNQFLVPQGIWIGDPVGNDGGRYLGHNDKYNWSINGGPGGPGQDRPPGSYAFGDTLIQTRAGTYGGNEWGEINIQKGVHAGSNWTAGVVFFPGHGGGSFGSGSGVVKAPNGKFYLCTVSPGTGAVTPPTHASGTAPTGDGYTWQWIGDQPAKWRRFGALMGDQVVTAQDPIFSLTQTWNNAAVAFAAHDINITDTASHTDSMLAIWRINNNTKAAIRKDGTFLSNGVPVVMVHELDALRDTIVDLRARIEALEA